MWNWLLPLKKCLCQWFIYQSCEPCNVLWKSGCQTSRSTRLTRVALRVLLQHQTISIRRTFLGLPFLASCQILNQILSHLSKKQFILWQSVIKAVSFLPAGVRGEGEDGAAGTLPVNAKTAVSIKPPNRQQLSGPVDELLTPPPLTTSASASTPTGSRYGRARVPHDCRRRTR